MYPEFYSLKYALYFVGPAIAIYVVAYVCAGALSFAADMVVEHDMTHDKAVQLMVCVVIATTAVATFAFFQTASVSVTVLAGAITFFFVGAVAYAVGLKAVGTHPGTPTVSSVGFWRGALISAIMTFGVLGFTLFLLWAGSRTP